MLGAWNGTYNGSLEAETALLPIAVRLNLQAYQFSLRALMLNKNYLHVQSIGALAPNELVTEDLPISTYLQLLRPRTQLYCLLIAASIKGLTLVQIASWAAPWEAPFQRSL